MQIIDSTHYLNQFEIFCKHLGQKTLAGVIIGERGARNVILDANSHKTIKLKPKENLYFVPQQCEIYSKADCVKKITTLFLDVDEISIKSDLVKGVDASIVLERSDRKAFQVFFFLDFELTPEEFKTYQLKLARKFGGDTSITNPNRLARVAGFVRGEKKKDKKMKLENDLFYETVYEGKLKYSREEIDKIVECEFDKETGEVFEEMPEDKPQAFEELHRDFTIEEGIFYTYFLNKSKGEGTSNILFRFGCFLLERGSSLEQFEEFASKNHIKIYEISHCDEEEWATLNINTRKYARNQQRKDEKDSFKAPTDGLKSKDELLEEYPFLHTAYADIKDYYFVEDEDKFYRHENEKLIPITKSIFSSTFSRYFAKVSKQGKIKPKNPVDVILARENRQHFNIVSSRLYMPHAALVEDKCLNTWAYPKLKSADNGSTTIFLEHIKFLFAGQTTTTGSDLGELFLDYLAYAYLSKTPPTYAYLIYSEKFGLGRSFFASVMKNLMGNNVSTPTDKIAKEQFTGWYSTKQLAIIEELGEDRNFFEQLKPIIGNKHVSHRQMGKDSQTVDNHCSILMLTNKIKALNIAKGDRRIAVVHMHQEPKDKSYYTRLYGWAENEANIAALAQFFRRRFETMDREMMKGHAPLTEAKLLTQRLVTDTETQNIEEALNEISFGLDGEFVCQRMLVERLYPNVTDAVVRYRGLVASRLSNLNYSPLVIGKSIRFGDEIKRVTIYVKTSLATKHGKNLQKVIDLYRDFVSGGKQKNSVVAVEEFSEIEKNPTQNDSDGAQQAPESQPEDYTQENAENFKKTKFYSVLLNLMEGEPECLPIKEPQNDKITPEKKPRTKKPPVVHPNVAKAQALKAEEEATGIKHVQQHTCADLKKARDEFLTQNIETDFLETNEYTTKFK